MAPSIVVMEKIWPRKQRLIVDELMPELLNGVAAAYQRASHWDGLCHGTFNFYESNLAGTWALFWRCKRVIQDKVVEATADGTAAAVNLGPGLNTLPYHEPVLAHTPACEVDQARQRENPAQVALARTRRPPVG